MILMAVIGIAIGVVIGWFSRSLPDGPCLGSDVPDKIIEDGEDWVMQEIFDRIEPERIKENLRWAIIVKFEYLQPSNFIYL